MKVLLVDDAMSVRMSLRNILDDSGCDFTYLEASTGTEAVREYKKSSPDLVIMDILMPEMDGITAVEKIMEENSQAKIIMCSANGNQKKVVQAVTAGAIDFIVKPYEAHKVIESVKSIRIIRDKCEAFL